MLSCSVLINGVKKSSGGNPAPVDCVSLGKKALDGVHDRISRRSDVPLDKPNLQSHPLRHRKHAPSWVAGTGATSSNERIQKTSNVYHYTDASLAFGGLLTTKFPAIYNARIITSQKFQQFEVGIFR